MKKLSIAVLLFSIAGTVSAVEIVEAVIARVGDRVLTQSQYIKRYEEMKTELQQGVPPDQLAAKTAELRTGLLEEMVNELLLKDRADRLDLTVSKTELDEAVGRLKKQYGITSDADFADSLRKSGMTRADMEAKLRDSLLTNKLFSKELRGRGELDDKELRERYEREKEQYRLPERAHVHEIILLIPAGADAEGVAAAQARANEAAITARSGDFAKAVAQYSEAPSKDKGGDLGVINRGELLKPLDDAVFNSASPAIVGPIQTRVGFHILQVDQRLPSEIPGFETVKDQLRKEVSDESFSRDLKAYLEKLRKDAYIQIHEDRIPTF